MHSLLLAAHLAHHSRHGFGHPVLGIFWQACARWNAAHPFGPLCA